MSIVFEKATVEAQATIVLSEPMFRAVAKVLEWGADEAVAGMIAHCSDREVKPHIHALQELFRRLRSDLPIAVNKADDARAIFNGTKVAHEKPAPKSGLQWRLVKSEEDDGID